MVSNLQELQGPPDAISQSQSRNGRVRLPAQAVLVPVDTGHMGAMLRLHSTLRIYIYMLITK